MHGVMFKGTLFLDSFCKIFSPPEWMQKRDTIAHLLENVKQSMGTISAITAANTYHKVCEVQQQIEEMKQMMKMGLEIRKSSRIASNPEFNRS
jgi:hypothetical protein